MIVVIADDFTGAAEIGGIGLRYGLRVILSDDADVSSSPDLLVIYTNTRSMKQGEAVELMADLTRKAMTLKPSLFYKKTDSVLRGHVLAEMKAQMEAMGLSKALLVPVNPFLRRIIQDGKYYINNQLIHQTGFASDPEFPIQDSDVRKILGDSESDVVIVAKQSQLPVKGIWVGEAQSTEDVTGWAAYQKHDIFLAGSAAFFSALLATKYTAGQESGRKETSLNKPTLFVSGTTFKKNVQRVKEFRHLVSYMPAAVFSNLSSTQNDFGSWADDITAILKKHGNAIVAIGEQENKNANSTLLRQKISAITKLILERTEVSELVVEGGATAFTIIQKLGFRSFLPMKEFQQGIVRMQVAEKEGMHLTIKPGSYDWLPQWFN